MSLVFYDPYIKPSKIHIVSKCFNIDMSFNTINLPSSLSDFKSLFDLSRLNSFDEVLVYFNEADNAYMRETKRSKKISLTGWVSLKNFEIGESFYKDNYIILEEDTCPKKMKNYRDSSLLNQEELLEYKSSIIAELADLEKRKPNKNSIAYDDWQELYDDLSGELLLL